MFQAKFLLTAGALAVVALIAGGTGSARAAEITFGNPTLPSAGTCAASANGADEGEICNNNLQFTAPDGTVLTANGYSDDTFLTSNGTDSSAATALTLKIVPPNSTDEGGLGENASGPTAPPNTTKCTDDQTTTACEIQPNGAVTVSSSGRLISDVLVGSVQAGFEAFQVWTDINGTWSQFGGDLSLDGGTLGPDLTTACNQVGTLSECQINLTTDASAIGVVDLTGVSPSDVLVTGVSLAPAPPIGQGLAGLLAVGGLLFGARLWERIKQRRPFGATA